MDQTAKLYESLLEQALQLSPARDQEARKIQLKEVAAKNKSSTSYSDGCPELPECMNDDSSSPVTIALQKLFK